MFCISSIFSINTLAAILIGIAGGTGSGKTTLAEKIQAAFPDQSILISQDSYYRDFSNLPLSERSKQNFDHPDALDLELLQKHLLSLKQGISIQQPVYSFSHHIREKKTVLQSPVPVIIAEGILLLAVPQIRDLFDLKIYVDTDDDIRLLRRIKRDMKERSRDFDGIKEQYLATVKPMHELFVEPSKQYADVIFPSDKENSMALSLVLCKLQDSLQKLEEPLK